MAEPGTLLHPANLSKKQLIDAKDTNGVWYRAKVTNVSGARAHVSYVGFRSHDTSFTARNNSIRARVSKEALKLEHDRRSWDNKTTGRLSSGEWAVRKVIGKKVVNAKPYYFLSWEGWSADYNSWESNVNKAVIEDFEEDQLKPPREPPKPYSVAECAHESAELCLQRVEDISIYLDDMEAEVAKTAPRQQKAEAEKKLYTTNPISSAEFVALRERLVRDCPLTRLDPNGDVDLVVTPIESERRGRKPVDGFSVMDDGQVNELFGENVLTMQEQSGAALKLVPPLDFAARATRRDDGGTLRPKELTVRAHWCALVPDLANPGNPIFKLDDQSFTYAANDRTKYKQAMAQALIRAQAQGSSVSDEFMAWAQEQ